MSLRLAPYPAYHPTDPTNHAAVPSHWKLARIKDTLREIDARVGDDDTLPLLSLTRTRGLIPQSEASNKAPAAADLTAYKIYSSGDLLMNRMQAWSGMFGTAEISGIVSPDYAVFKPAPSARVQYLLHLCKTPQYVAEFRRHSKGIGSGFNRLYTEDFGAVPTWVPPLAEQDAICNFVHEADRRINRLVRAKRRLIELLNEQKQAIIHRAVTRGLDPNVRLKPSGIDWLGDVPEAWEVRRLKTITKFIVDCLHATPRYTADGLFPAIRTADVEPGHIRVAGARRIGAEQFQQWTFRAEPIEGDILYSREGERYGIAAPVPAGVRLCISQRMMHFRVDCGVSSAYVMWQLNCPHVQAQASADVVGATAPHVNVETIRNYWLMLPPLGEQEAIARFIAEETAGAALVIDRTRREIDLLREYRTRLIADVVTGKLDVRGVELPPLDGDGALDEIDATDDGDAEEPPDEELGEGDA